MRIVAVMIILATLAGCSDKATPVEEDPLGDLGGEVTATTGLIRGVVVDEAIIPLVDATVRIKSVERETTTNEKGAFVIDGLDEGTYFLEVAKAGYGVVQQSVSVEAGVANPPAVRVQLQSDPSQVPLAITGKFEGHLLCTITGVVFTFAACAELDDRFITFIDVDGYPDHIQSELRWESTQSTGDGLQLWVYDGTLSAPKKAIGTSPIMVSEPRAFWENGTGGVKEGQSAYVDPGKQMAFRVFADGADGTNQCSIVPLCVGGVGVAIEQPFEIYTTTFWRMTPDEGWMFVNDGDHPLP